jgi:carbonic anhydrase
VSRPEDAGFTDDILARNRVWAAERRRVDPTFFERLAGAQTPEILYIGCSDSRVAAEELMGIGPGTAFVHRNIANLVVATDLNALGVIESWLRNIRDVYRLHHVELDAIADPAARVDRLVERNVEEQCLNVVKTAALQRAVLATGLPTVHGWVFDLGTGLITDLEVDTTAMLRSVRDIYDLGTTAD